jgi:hypothetical protein
MPNHPFAPGFRLSLRDAVVLVAGVIAAPLLATMVWWWGFVVAFVVAHFFLFCNVVRMARPLELAWTAVFLAVTVGTITLDFPGWPVAIPLSLAATATVVALQLRKPSYHGIAWQRINPRLPEWWAAQQG